MPGIMLSGQSRRRIAPTIMVVLLLFGQNAHPAEVRTSTSYRKAPSFSRVALDHTTVNLAAYRGKVVVLNFWATWCQPCLNEAPRFAEWQKAYGGRGLQIIGVSMDDEEPPVRAISQKYGLNYPIVMGDEKLGAMYGDILGLPVTFLIDRNGRIRFEHQGAADLEIIKHEILSLLQLH